MGTPIFPLHASFLVDLRFWYLGQLTKVAAVLRS